jgi:hypothetical protein
MKITEQLGKTQGCDSWIVFRATGYNPETRELAIHIEKIGDPRWWNYLDEGMTYTFKHDDSDEPQYKEHDPLEMWKLPTNQKKWIEKEHIVIPEYDLVLPQILLYFWHNDSKLSMEWDW